MLGNMMSAVLERLLQRKMIAVQPIDVSKTGMMLLNNAVSLIPMGALLFAFGEHKQWYQLRQMSQLDMVLLFCSCLNAIGISYAGINAQGYVSATTFMVLSNLNKFVVVGFGMLVLREASSWRAVLGCVIALSGGVLYAQAKSWGK
jgi:drug/metabolite transporter (DMT)-like permease